MVNSVGSVNGFSQGQNAPADMTSKLTSLGIPSDVIQKGPDAVKQYAQQNGITLPEPPARHQENQNLFNDAGKEKKADGNPPQDMIAKLTAAGVPLETISQGRAAVMEYCEKNNITLPEPPAKPNNGTSEGNSLNVNC